MFNLAVDSWWRQSKTGRPVRFELTDLTPQDAMTPLREGGKSDAYFKLVRDPVAAPRGGAQASQPRGSHCASTSATLESQRLRCQAVRHDPGAWLVNPAHRKRNHIPPDTRVP
jgi:hypothetical protein